MPNLKNQLFFAMITLIFAGCMPKQLPSQPLEKIILKAVPARIMSMDGEKKVMEILKASSLNPYTGKETSSFEAVWTDKTVFLSTEELENFKSIKKPVITDFHGIRKADANALAIGEPFEARVAIIMPFLKKAEGLDKNHRKVVGWFTPDNTGDFKSGTILVKDKNIRVSMRKKYERIFLKKHVSSEEVSQGYWNAKIDGYFEKDKIVIEKMEFIPKVNPIESDDPLLPRVMVVGDSISMNYHEAAKTELKGIANYYRIDGNSGSTVGAIKNMDMWLGDYTQKGLQWDVIQFNSGLHDMKQKILKGAYAVPIEKYKRNLVKEIELLKKTGATLIWCATTPVQNDSGNANYAFRTKGAEKVFNQAALEVLREYPEILINNLSEFIYGSKVFDQWRKARDVHFYRKEEQAALGKSIADKVKKALIISRLKSK